VSDRYRIRVKGHLDPRWSEWFGGLTIRNRAGGEAELVGRLVDQAALHGVLTRVRDRGLPLISVRPIATRARPLGPP
jgi:hypothetical protein